MRQTEVVADGPPDPTERLALTVAEVRHLTGLGRQATYTLAREIGFRAKGRRWLISTERLRAWLASQ